MESVENMTECTFVCRFVGCRYNTAPVCEDDMCPSYRECRACVSDKCAKKNPHTVDADTGGEDNISTGITPERRGKVK